MHPNLKTSTCSNQSILVQFCPRNKNAQFVLRKIKSPRRRKFFVFVQNWTKVGWANKQVSKNGSPLVVTYMLSEVFTWQLNFQVVAVARRIDRLKKLKVEVGETNLFPYKCDLANSNEIKSMIDWIKNTFGG